MIEAGPGFFDTLRIPLLYGRVFDARDRADTPRVAVITDRMARQYFGALDAVGRRFRLQNDPNSWGRSDWRRAGYRHGRLRRRCSRSDSRPPYYRSYTQSGAPPTTIIARSSGDAAALVAAMQRELRAVDVTLPVVTASTMARRLEGSQAAPKAVANVSRRPSAASAWCWPASVSMRSSRLPWQGGRVRSAFAWRSALAVSRSCGALREAWRG